VTLTNWWYNYVCSTCRVVWLKKQFETWIDRNDVNGENWFQFSYYNNCFGLPVLTISTTCPNQVIMFDWSIYRIFVLNKALNPDSLQMIIFVQYCSTCSVFGLKTQFETWIAWNEVSGACTFHISYLITVLALDINLNLVPLGTKCRNQVFYVWLFDLQSICAIHGLETWLSPNNDIRMCLFDMQHSWTKNAFWEVDNKKWRKWCKFVSPYSLNNIYGLPVLTIDTEWPNHVFYVWLVDLQTICAN
jgi:hypothetical protein